MSWLSKAGKKVERYISSKVPHVHSEEKRAAMQATKEQIDYYQQAKNELGEQRKANEQAKNDERKKINEREIKARQRTYRRAGFMSEPQPGIAEKLG